MNQQARAEQQDMLFPKGINDPRPKGRGMKPSARIKVSLNTIFSIQSIGVCPFRANKNSSLKLYHFQREIYTACSKQVFTIRPVQKKQTLHTAAFC